jgi:hypothetical protein
LLFETPGFGFQQVAQFAFEQELASKQDYRVTTDTFIHIMNNVRASLSDEVIEEFEKDSVSNSRFSGDFLFLSGSTSKESSLALYFQKNNWPRPTLWYY